ncbi:transposable element Tcb1 transposase [Trichonephila clavipes]|nr:transposable element Tcb1 transposase [Trichonephila clavipes]
MWAAEWNEVVFTDESRICQQHNDGRIRVWRHRGERMLNTCIMHSHTGPAPGIMVWGGIAYHSRARLVRIADSVEDIRLNERDCEESKENANVIDNIPVNPDIRVARDGTNGYRIIVMFLADFRLEMFCDKAMVQQASRNIMLTFNWPSRMWCIFDIKIVVEVAEWSRYRIVACLVTSSSPVPLNTRHVGQRCTLNLSSAETSSRWCGVVVRRGGASSGVVHVT